MWHPLLDRVYMELKSEARQTLLDYFNRVERSAHLDFRPRKRLLYELRCCVDEYRATFLELMDDLPLNRHTLRAGIYEALSEDAEAWETFYLRELDRLFTAADEALNPWPLFRTIRAFEHLWRVTEGALQRDVRRYLLLQTRAPYARIRRVATELLGYFVYPDNAAAIRQLERLTRDDDRLVRFHAYALLSELRGYPPLSDIRLTDFLIAKLKWWLDEL